MGRIVLVAYRPYKGKERDFRRVLKTHLPILRAENLTTERAPIVMKAQDGTYIEIFEWKSEEAIEEAHQNKAVLSLWEKLSHVCDYEKPTNIDEFHQLFSEFEAVDL